MISLPFAPPVVSAANHVWQSSWFACGVGLAALALRRRRARWRCALWLAASVKFLVPFAVLATLGSYLPRPEPRVAAVAPPRRVIALSRPFTAPDVFALPAAARMLPLASPAASFAAEGAVAVWLCGALAVFACWGARWRSVAGLARRARPLAGLAGVPPDIRVLISDEILEAGAFGILRPRILLPAIALDGLSRDEQDGLLRHEMAHIRRRDNLWAAVHMAVEALFWFHPLVWWLGARILEDRERACDEAVLDAGCDAEAYAAGLLRVCRDRLARNRALVSCAGGSDLKRRIAAIMTRGAARNLTALEKALVAGGLAAAIAAPVAAGLAAARPTRAQEPQTQPALKFDAASVKPSGANDTRIGAFPSPGRLAIHNFTLKRLILMTYRLKDFQMDGAKGWMDSDKWDVEGVFAMTPGQSSMQLGADRMPALLEERFHLKVHREMRQLPVYALVAAKGGPKLKRPDPSDGRQQSLRVLPPRADPAGFTYIKMDFRWFGDLLSGELNLPVVDKTGITGIYDVTLSYTSHVLLDDPDYRGNGVSVFTALQEQLGLKLEESKGPVEVMVVDHAEKPEAN